MSAAPRTERGKAIVEAAREMADAAERAATAYERGDTLSRAQYDDEAAKARTELDRLVAEWEVQSGPAFEAAALSGADSIALLVRALHERAQQAESTRDAAQARATACEERARRAEQQSADAVTSRDDWRACALHGSRLVIEADDGTDFAGGRIAAEMAIVWARDVALADEPRSVALARAERERAAAMEAERDEWRDCAEEGATIVRQTFPADTQIGRWAAAVPLEDPAAGTGDHELEPGRMGE